MSILKELLEELIDSELDDQVKILCDKIIEEERENENEPIGPNIFLTIPIPSIVKTKQKFSGIKTFLCLERDFKEKYYTSVWTYNITSEKQKRIKTWNIPNHNKAIKILETFTEQLKIMRGK